MCWRFRTCGNGIYGLFRLKQKEQSLKTGTIAGALFLVAGIVNIFVPDETVLYKMLTASYVTPDNIGAAQNNVVNFVGKIAEQLAKMK